MKWINKPKISIKRHALPNDRSRASAYAEHVATKAKAEREMERRRVWRRAAYHQMMERV
jgi:hypothetical protein